MKKMFEASTVVLFMMALLCCGLFEGNYIKQEHLGITQDSQMEQDEDDISVVIKDKFEHTDSLESSSESEAKEDDPTENESSENTSTEEQSTEESSKEEGSTDNIPIGENFISEDKIFSFFQRSEAWCQGVAWSGEWSTLEYKGRIFSDFGCGLCCMANVYDTLSPYEVSPKDMFYRAMNVSSYAPSSSGAAISWWNMRTTLKNCGISCKLYNKPSSYAAFQQQISQCTSAIVLVSSAYDNTYWTTTKGHYVTIWNYDRETDTVFLADPGKISHNRERIPLRYVYNAFKLSSDYQFLAVTEYVEENNQWKGNGIKDQWIRPFP